MKDQEIVKGRYEQIRSVMAKYPDVTKAKNLKNLVIEEFNLKYNKKQKHTLRKVCWDMLNRRNGPNERNTVLPHSARILVFDIETAPILTYVWRRWQQNVFSDQTIHDDWPILTFSAKWLCEDHMISVSMTPKEAIARDDRRVVKELWKLFEEADMVIAHNGRKFDRKMANARFMLAGLNPPASYHVIDTLLSAKKSFAFPSNKLDDLCKYFGLEGKIKTEMSWWTEFLEGKKEAIDRMQKYNDQDVLALEEVYLKMRSWIQPHPNLGLFIGEDIQSCPTCGGTHLTPILKPYVTTMNMYQQLRCDDCGGMSRTRLPSNQIRADKKALSSSLPR